MTSTFRFLAVAALLALPSVASAQTPPTPPTPPPDAHQSDDQAARLLYDRGAEALQAGDYQTALDRFQQAYDLSHRAVLLYNIGTTLDRLRRDRDALAAFQQFLEDVPDHPRRAEVQARVTALSAAIAEQDRQRAEAEEQARLQREAAEQARLEAEQRAEQARLDREAAERRAAEASDGLPPAVVISVGSAAVVAGTLGIVFGLRTNTLNDDYRQRAFDYAHDPDGALATEDQIADVRGARDDAQTVQRVTNICYFSSAALAAGAVTLIFFTDWNGDESATASMPRTLPVMTATRGGGMFGIQHRF